MAMTAELPGAAEPAPAGAGGLREGIGVPDGRLPMPAAQFRLGIEGVDVRDAAVHEEEYHALGARREMRPHRGFARVRLLRQTEKGEPAEAEMGAPQQVAA